MSTRVAVNPDQLHWALTRAGLGADALGRKQSTGQIPPEEMAA